MPIPTYIINLKKRVDRRISILKEFEGRGEFDVTIVEACTHERGATGLWETIKHILQQSVSANHQYILICEDDHQFTEHYSSSKLFNCIADAISKGADILCGGVSWFEDAIGLGELFLVSKFSGLQFTIIFRKFFESVVSADFSNFDVADSKISAISRCKFVIHPFVSIQKEFGYSDATAKNNIVGRVEDLFSKSSESFQNMRLAKLFYDRIPIEKEDSVDNIENIVIPTYIIHLTERIERQEDIKREFNGKNEFDLTIVEVCRNEMGALGLWESIRKIVQIAIVKDDDVIVISQDDHEFTEHYSRNYLIRNIIEAHAQGADILSGGSSEYNYAVQIATNRFWIHSLLPAPFIVLYRKFFQRILDEPFDEDVKADSLLSILTSHKMLLYPFVSRQHDGFSLIPKMVSSSNKRLNNLISYISEYK